MKVYTYNDKVLVNSANDKWLKKKVDPYNPLGLEPGVFRIKVTPGTSSWLGAQTATLVTGTTDTYDVQFTESNTAAWNKAMALEVLGANTTGWTTGFARIFNGCSNLTNVAIFDTSSATTLSNMFDGCYSLTSVPLFDTSSATNMNSFLSSCRTLTSIPLFDTSSATTLANMLQGCDALTSIPLFDTSNVTDISAAFNGCTNVQSGALALYQQASTQTNPPADYQDCFAYCGSNTVTGAAELAQIPSSWGGTGA